MHDDVKRLLETTIAALPWLFYTLDFWTFELATLFYGFLILDTVARREKNT